MNITSMAQDALAALYGANTDYRVAVVIRGTSGYGLRVDVQDATDFSVNGEVGLTTGTVRVSAAAFDRPTHGETILVDGNSVVVTQVDGKALHVITYRGVRKVSGT